MYCRRTSRPILTGMTVSVRVGSLLFCACVSEIATTDDVVTQEAAPAHLASGGRVAAPASATVQQDLDEWEGAVSNSAESWDRMFESIADLTGWTKVEVREHWEATEEVGRIAELILEHEPEAFAGSVAGKTADEMPKLLIKGEASPYVRRLLASSDKAIELWEKQPFSATELGERKRKIATQLEKAGLDWAMVTADVVDGGRIRVSLSDQALQEVESPTHPGGGWRFKGSALPFSSDVAIDMVPAGRVEPTFLAQGGMQIGTAGMRICSTAFSVQSTTDITVTGVATAGHCVSAGMDRVFHGSVTHQADAASSVYNRTGDAAWYTTDVPEPAKFWDNTFTQSNVTTVGVAAATSPGSFVCGFSRQQSKKICGIVVDNNASVLVIPNTSAPRKQVDGVVTVTTAFGTNNFIPGDSGSSVYQGNRAMGIEINIFDADNDGNTDGFSYTPADKLSTLIDARVMTCGSCD